MPDAGCRTVSVTPAPATGCSGMIATVKKPRDPVLAMLGDLQLRSRTLKVFPGGREFQLVGAVADVGEGANSKRVTVTRVAVLGVFALAAKKGNHDVYLTINGPDFDLVRKFPVKQEIAVRRFAARLNRAARDLETVDAEANPVAPNAEA